MKRFVAGILVGALGAAVVAHAAQRSQSDILYNIVSQNFYLTQKVIALTQAHQEILMQIADRTKVKTETIMPITNRLQQELFNIDLKLKELNR